MNASISLPFTYPRISLPLTYLGFAVAGTAIRMQTHPGLVLQEPPFDLVLDVGAFEGQFAISARQQGYTGKIVSFEPEKDSFQKLESARASDVNWTAVQLALGETEGSAPLNVAPNRYFNSFHNKIPGIFDGKKQKSPIVILDNWLAEKKIEEKRLFLNLDTQGSEMTILMGAIKSLSRIAAIQIKVSVDSARSHAPEDIAALNTLRHYGYEILFTSPVEGYPPERNCTFIRK